MRKSLGIVLALMLALPPIAAQQQRQQFAGQGRIEGILIGPSGPLAEMPIQVLNDSGVVILCAVTSRTGNFVLTGLSAGTYVIQAISCRAPQARPDGTPERGLGACPCDVAAIIETASATLTADSMIATVTMSASAAALAGAASAAAGVAAGAAAGAIGTAAAGIAGVTTSAVIGGIAAAVGIGGTEAGFEVTAVAGRPRSARVAAFAAKFGIPTVADDPLDLAASGGWDAMLIAVPPAAALRLLQVAASSGRPVLVEKPVALSSEALRPIADSWPHVLVGYNRRFYATVRAAREFADRGGPCLVRLEQPDQAAGTPAANGDIPLTGSVHGFDLLRYLFGPLRLEAAAPYGRAGRQHGAAAILASGRGDVIQYDGCWDAPASVSLTLDRGGRRVHLQPFERAATYDGVDVVEPTVHSPVRRYVPRQTAEVPLDEVDARFKPGFVAQARALQDRCAGRASPIAATLAEAVAALELAEAVSTAATVETGA